MLTELFRCYGLRVLTDDIDPAQSIGAITSFAVPDDVQVQREAVDGNIFPSLTTLLSHTERIDVTSLNVDQLLDMVGTIGLCAKGVSSQTGVELFLSQVNQCTPGVNTGAVNMRVSAKSTSGTSAVFGMFTPGQITANQGSDATMSIAFTPTANGGNAGFTVAEDQTLPAIADTKSRFSLAEQFDLNGTSITGKKSLGINFNAQLLREAVDGSLAPDWVSIESLMSMITISGINPTWAANIPRGGKSFAHANCTFYLRQRSPDSATGFYADSENKHIKITAAGKAFVTNLASGQTNRPVESAIVMYVEFDGTNAPIVINTNQQIT